MAADVDKLLKRILEKIAEPRSHQIASSEMDLGLQFYKSGAIERLARAPSIQYFNRRKMRAIWPKWMPIYLVAVARMRLELAYESGAMGQIPSQAKAIALVSETFDSRHAFAALPAQKKKHRPKTIEAAITAMRSAWPIVSGVLYVWEKHRLLNGEGMGIMEFAPQALPTASDLIDLIVSRPAEVFMAVREFQDVLEKAGIEHAPRPHFIVIPEFSDLPCSTKHYVSVGTLTEKERIVVQGYTSSKRARPNSAS